MSQFFYSEKAGGLTLILCTAILLVLAKFFGAMGTSIMEYIQSRGKCHPLGERWLMAILSFDRIRT
jgi:hypothetical protein